MACGKTELFMNVLFFSNEDRVITITDYLTAIIVVKDQELYENIEDALIKALNPQFL